MGNKGYMAAVIAKRNKKLGIGQKPKVGFMLEPESGSAVDIESPSPLNNHYNAYM